MTSYVHPGESLTATAELLAACMDDVIDADPESAAKLAGLPLAPLADGRRSTLRLALDVGPQGLFPQSDRSSTIPFRSCVGIHNWLE